MKKLILFGIAGIIIFISCKKEVSCEGCSTTNKIPIANAGANQSISLPTDSVLLDGSASTDPDGSITEWQWTKISGPASFTFSDARLSKTIVTNLNVGIYHFELLVKDNDGLSAKDTVQIILSDPTQPNRPPVAYAGADQTILSSITSVNLNGSGSSDPDNNITSYTWTKIAGPVSFNIIDINSVQTQAANLVMGTYQFELKVTDAGGLFDTDTIEIIVNPVVLPSVCIIPGATQVGTFPSQRAEMTSVVFNNKFYFVSGGVVEIFDPVTNNLTNTQSLSINRLNVSAVATSEKIFFAGGYVYNSNPSAQETMISRVDIYSSNTGTWSTAELSLPRTWVCTATIGNKVFFAGGYTGIGSNASVTDRLDIYDNTTNTWSQRALSKAGRYISTIVENKIWFVAEGSNLIDVYDPVTNTWGAINLSFSINASAGLFSNPAAITLDNKIYFTGERIVQVYDVPSQSWSSFTLSENKFFIPAAVSNNKLVFIGGMTSWFVYSNRMEIYDPATGSLSTQYMSSDYYYASFISYNNYIYSAGGLADQENTNVYSICRFQL